MRTTLGLQQGAEGMGSPIWSNSKEWGLPGRSDRMDPHDPRSLDAAGAGGVLHAKALVADGETLFITSANVTCAAQNPIHRSESAGSQPNIGGERGKLLPRADRRELLSLLPPSSQLSITISDIDLIRYGFTKEVLWRRTQFGTTRVGLGKAI